MINLDPLSEQFLNGMARLNVRLDRAQRQLSSGRRISVVSDEPDRVARLVETRNDLGRIEQIQRNLGIVKGDVDTAEAVLQSGVSLLERARTLAVQGANGTQTAATRRAISAEVGDILEHLVGIANTTFQGRYLFGGDRDTVPPYIVDPSQTNGVGEYAGTDATRSIEHPTGIRIVISHTAQEIFEDPAGQNVFAAVKELQRALAANDDGAIEAAIGLVTTAHGQLGQALGTFGLLQNQISEATDFAGKQQTLDKIAQSNLEDADLAAATVELNQARFEQQSAYAARARAPRTSLFDFLG
ncbi:MAG: flagellar hook-associated protein 3 [Bryobacterales bacterium]|nr:flagellar hook-associated protein 3 [Bryobacterales bacterium]